MKREIKFRAWHKNNKSMCQNVTTDLLDRDYLEFMQFTGLKDIEGNEIYEGDLLDGEDLVRPLIVTYDVGTGGWTDDSYVDYLHNSIGYFSLKVVGNIFENENLLNR